MIAISVKLDVAEARRTFANMRKEVNKAAIQALERVAITVRKEASIEIRQSLAIAAAVAKDQIKLYRPYGSQRLIRDIVATGKPIALRDYGARELKGGKGVSYRVSKRRGRRLYVAKGNKAFVIDRFGKNVFVRTAADPPGPSKGKVRKVYGPSVPQYFVTRFVRERIKAIVATRWPIEFKSALAYRTGVKQ